MKERVIILGTAPTLALTPWDLDNCDYWACQPVITHPPSNGHRLDALFELHETSYWTTIIERMNKYIQSNPDCKIYMQESYNQVKNSVKYPLDEVQTFINHPRMRNYFTSTIAYIIALAIVRGYNKIELYGVHMASGEEEYSGQRSCVEALLAYAWGKGIDFWLPDESDVMKSTYLYGYEQSNGILLKAIQYKKAIAKGAADLKNKLKKAEEEYWQQKGGVLTMDRYIQDLKKQGLQ